MDVSDIVARARDHLVVERAFGTPVEHDGTVVVPVAIVIGGGGGGQGTTDASRRGEGGGFGGLVYPIGAYSIREGRVRFVPSVNVTRIVTAVLLVVRAITRRRTRVIVTTPGRARVTAPGGARLGVGQAHQLRTPRRRRAALWRRARGRGRLATARRASGTRGGGGTPPSSD
jgi:uncharacterized spore protein YtfJ